MNMNKPQGQRPDAENGEKESPLDTGIGALFRHEREKKGLSYLQVYEITRVRPFILEALENEDWDRLPAPVFVTGFIRSYARALGMDDREVINLYQEFAPAEIPPPKPLVEPTRSRRQISVLLIFLLLAVACAYYMWREYPTPETTLITPETIGTKKNDKITRLKDIQKPPDETEQAPMDEQEASLHGPEMPLAQRDLAPETSSELFEMEMPEDLLADEEGIPSSAEQILHPDSVIGSMLEKPAHNHSLPPDGSSQRQEVSVEAGGPVLILKANVKKRTYVKIFVDDQDAKEYIFRPGSHPDWKAKEGFELLIGNAGGIDLELNGKKIEKLGNPGQVVRVKLPEGYERKHSRE